VCVREIPAPPPICRRQARAVERPSIIYSGDRFNFIKLDYCNSVLAGLPGSTLAPLQRVLHVAKNDLKASDHVTSTLVDLHWLPIEQCVDYKLCCHVHNVFIGQAPAYLSDILTTCADVPSFSRLRTSSSGDFMYIRFNISVSLDCLNSLKHSNAFCQNTSEYCAYRYFI